MRSHFAVPVREVAMAAPPGMREAPGFLLLPGPL